VPAAAPVWKPNVTVAAIIERDGSFLLIEEETTQGPLFNQPAGHLEPGESLQEAVVRETLEESAYTFTPSALIGIYQYRPPGGDLVYLRFAYTGHIAGHDPRRTLDAGILRALWMPADEVRATAKRHRSPLVVRCMDDYLAGRRYPLELVDALPGVRA
jgi:8-oxo-dGTP pyrophosphatase MutT (NUDIX family)